MEGYPHKKNIHVTCEVAVGSQSLSRPAVKAPWAVQDTKRESRERMNKEIEKELKQKTILVDKTKTQLFG